MDVCDRPALPYTTMLASLLLEGSQQAQKEIDSLVGALRAGLPWFWSEPNKRSKEDHHHHRHDSPQRQQSLRAALVSSGVVDGVGIWKTRLLSSVSVIQFGGVAAAALSCMSPQVCMQLLGQVHCCCRHSRDRSFYSQEQLHVKIACHVVCQPCTRLGFFIAKLSAWCMPVALRIQLHATTAAALISQFCRSANAMSSSWSSAAAHAWCANYSAASFLLFLSLRQPSSCLQGPGCCDFNKGERVANVLTSLPYAAIGLHSIR